MGEPEKCQNATLAGEARSDDHSDHHHRAPRTTRPGSPDDGVCSRAHTVSEGHPAAHRSRFPEGLDGSGTGPVAVEIHQGRGGPQVSPRVDPSQEEQPHGRSAYPLPRAGATQPAGRLVLAAHRDPGRATAAGGGRGRAVVLARCSRRTWPKRPGRSTRCWPPGRPAPKPAPPASDQAGYGAGPAAYLSLVTQAKAALSVPVIASLNGVSRAAGSAMPAGWRGPGPTPSSSTSTMCPRGQEFLERGRVALPGRGPRAPGHRDPAGGQAQPLFQLAGELAGQLVEAGAGGLVLFNRFSPTWTSRPDVRPALELSSSTELRLPLRWIAILHRRFGVSLAARPGSIPPRTSSRCCWPGRTWP